ncbi:hypothetical protein CLU79DRAFT_835214 [Phycomyces nitens]|nr:hypothetical protein CLU79DRAFT_835214 [Phycomyces nitens]
MSVYHKDIFLPTEVNGNKNIQNETTPICQNTISVNLTAVDPKEAPIAHYQPTQPKDTRTSHPSFHKEAASASVYAVEPSKRSDPVSSTVAVNLTPLSTLLLPKKKAPNTLNYLGIDMGIDTGTPHIIENPLSLIQPRQECYTKAPVPEPIQSVQSCHKPTMNSTAPVSWESMFDPFSTFQRSGNSVVYKPWSSTPAILACFSSTTSFPLDPTSILRNPTFAFPTSNYKDISVDPDTITIHYNALQDIRSDGEYRGYPHNFWDSPSNSLDGTTSVSLVCRQGSLMRRILQSIRQTVVITKYNAKYFSKEHRANPACRSAAIPRTELQECLTVNRAPIERVFFWLGFLCPLFWIGGSIGLTRDSADNRYFKEWQGKCRMALMGCGVVIGIGVLVGLVQATWIAGSRQSASEAILAVISS